MIGKIQLERDFKGNSRRYISEWMELLRFPSVGADPSRDRDCLACARWLARHLKSIGMDARLLATPGKPLVFGEKKGKPGKPVVLLYGHYDVQPEDPLDEWKSGPFDPVLRNGRMYARGAQDNKGQFLSALNGIETLIRHNALDCTVKVVLEGEEEYGSHGIAAVLGKYRNLLKADVMMVADSDTVASGAPTIVMGLRGVIFVEVELRGPRHDLHSGLHGGVAPNPADAIARLVSTLHNPDGSIAVKGFYEGVKLPTKRERELAAANPFSASEYARTTGVRPVAGEKRFTPVERLGFRPTVDVIGIHSGYGGSGSKTIIPARGFAKITARPVSGQDPAKCVRLIVEHLRRHVPEGLRMRIVETSAAGPALRLDPDSPLAGKAARVLDRLSGRKTAFLWEGASIPILSALSRASGAEPLLVGFGHSDDMIHAPNESYSIRQFRLGYLYTAMMLDELGR